jgi:hypothetical protein
MISGNVVLTSMLTELSGRYGADLCGAAKEGRL